MYSENSDKSVERIRRGCREMLLVEKQTKRLKYCKSFMTKLMMTIKKQLVQVLLNSWNSDASAELLRGHTVTLICGGEGFEQTSYGESTFCSAVPSY